MNEQKNALEWGVFALSAALIAATVGRLGYDAFAAPQVAADFSVSLGEPVPRPDGVLVRVYVKNHGTGSAEKVRVHVQTDDPAVFGDLELEFVPRSSVRDAYVYLPHAAPGLRARVVGWVNP